MLNLLTVTKRILEEVEQKSGKSIQFLRDDKLAVLATLQMARNGAPYHVLRYQPTDSPLDYIIAFQAGFVLRLFENEPQKRFDFSPEPNAEKYLEVMLNAGQHLSESDRKVLPDFAKSVSQWALMNLRSLPIGMRIDQWISKSFPELADLQNAGTGVQQQQNMSVLSYQLGKLTIPTTLLSLNAAYALFADRLRGTETYAIPYGAAGVLEHGRQLLEIWDATPPNPSNDCELVDRWAKASGMNNWYKWIPYNS